MDFYTSPQAVEKFFDRILEIKINYWKKVFESASNEIDVIEEADDLGSQSNLLISPELYRKFLKPRQKELFEFIHKNSNAKVLYHSCGSIKSLIPDLIEIGVDALNPIQFSALGMDSNELKREFGKELVFWGGGIETQNILPKGTTEEVKSNVKRQLEVLSKNGGYIFSTVHNIQADVSPENFLAMWEAFQEFNK